MIKKRKYGIATAFTLNFLLGMIIVAVGFFMGDGTFYLGTDFNYQQIPFNMLAAESIKTGNILWLDNFELGASFIGALSFYVLGSPFFWITLLIPSAEYSILVPLLFSLKFAVAGTGAYCYAHQYIKESKWAIISSMLYAFSGYQLMNMNYNHFLDVTALFPFLLLALDMNVKNDKKGWFAIMVAIMALTNYFFFISVVVFLIIYFVVKLLTKDYSINARLFTRLAFESVIGVGMAMILLLPNIFFLLDNPRISESIFGLEISKMLFLKPYQYADLLYSMLLPAENIFNKAFILSSDPTGSAMYLPVVGFIPTFAFMLNHKNSWLTKLSIVCFVFMSMPLLNSAFVAFNSEYYARWLFMPILIFSVMAGKHFENKENIKNGMKVWLLVVILFYFARLMWKYYFHVEFFPNKLLAIVFCIVGLAGVVTLIFIDIIKEKKQALYLLILAIFIQTTACFVLNTYYTHKFWDNGYMPAKVFFNDVPNMKYPNEDEYYRTDTKDIYINTGIISDKPSINIFASNITGSIFDFYKSAELSRSVNSIIPGQFYGYYTVLGTKYIIKPEGETLVNGEQGFSKKPVYNDTGFDFYENENYLGMGFSYDKAISKSEFSKINKELKHFVMVDAIVLDDDIIENNKDLFEIKKSEDYHNFEYEDMRNSVLIKNGSKAKNFKYEASKYTFDVSLEKNTIYYVAVPYDKGFKATNNGLEVQIMNVNNGLIGLDLPKGENHVELSYMPIGLKTGSAISIISVIGFGMYSIFCRRKNENKR